MEMDVLSMKFWETVCNSLRSLPIGALKSPGCRLAESDYYTTRDAAVFSQNMTSLPAILIHEKVGK